MRRSASLTLGIQRRPTTRTVRIVRRAIGPAAFPVTGRTAGGRRAAVKAGIAAGPNPNPGGPPAIKLTKIGRHSLAA
jgi:hypothetical protein